MTNSPDIAFSIDSTDRITTVNEAWSVFARANDGEHLLPPGILGRKIWDFICDDATRQIYARLLMRVRGGARPARFRFRCDSPGERRVLRMEITSGEAAAVQFTVTPLVVEPRPAVRLLASATTRSNRLLRICGWCMRVPTDDGRWLEVEEALSVLNIFDDSALPQLTHGICPACSAALTKAAREEEPPGSPELVLGALPGV